MNNVKALKYSLVLTLMFLLMNQTVFAKKMYRWVDDRGKIFYSDQVPPDQMKHRREALSNSARVIKVIEKEKTKSQRDVERRLAILRKQQEVVIKKQKFHDKFLLSGFRNIRDMQRALKGRIMSLDRQETIVLGKLGRLEKALKKQLISAAQYERDGNKVPEKLLREISRIKKNIDQAHIDVAHQAEKKKREIAVFEADIDRFRFLTHANEASEGVSAKRSIEIAENKLGLYPCESIEKCKKAWEIAKTFVIEYSSTTIDITTDRLIMSLAPYKDSDLSLSVSKINSGPNNQKVFLDIRCHNSSVGRQLCQSKKVLKMRQSFSRYIKAVLIKQELEMDLSEDS